MNVSSVQSLYQSTSIFVENQIFKPLTAQQQKIAAVALVIFGLLASTFLVYYYHFRTKKIKVEESESGENKVDSPITLPSRFEEFKRAVQKDGLALEHAPDNIRTNRTIVKFAVQQNGWALRFAEEFQTDEEIVKLAIEQDPYALQFAASKLQNKFEIVMLAVKKNGYTVQFVGENLRKNKDAMRQLITLAVAGDGLALEFAPLELRNDRKIVKLAVQHNGWALQFASPDLQDDPEIVELAVKQKKAAVKFASLQRQTDPKIMRLVK